MNIYFFFKKAWAKSGKGEFAARKAEEILNQMEQLGMSQPSTISYNYVLDAWAKSRAKNSTARVEAILEQMHTLFDSGHNVKPNRFTYTIVINTLARSKERGAARRTEAILHKMLEHYSNSSSENDDDLKPSTPTFNAVIDSWARSGEKDAGERAEAVLDRFIELVSSRYDSELRPNATTFNSTITAWARSGDTRAGEKAEALLSRMECYEGVYPDTVTFNALITAYGRSNDVSSVSLAEAVVDRMEEIYEDYDDFVDDDDEGLLNSSNGLLRNIHPIKPNVITYNSLIDVYARSNMPGKARKAQEIFVRILSAMDIEPNIVTYCSLLKACARIQDPRDSKEVEEALAIGMEIYNHFKESSDNKILSANNVLYRVLMDVADRLIHNKNELETFVSEVFGKCCQEGYLDNVVLHKVRRRVSPYFFQTLMAQQNVKIDLREMKDIQITDLPPKWSRQMQKNHVASFKRNRQM